MTIRSLLGIVVLWLGLQALCAHPALANADFDQGVKLYTQRQYKPALDLFLRAANADPRSSSAYFYAGNCFYQLGNIEKARQTYSMVVQYYPQSAEAGMAREFLTRLQAAQTEAAAKKSGADKKQSGAEPKEAEPAQVASTASAAPSAEDDKPIDCRDLLVVVRPQKDRPPVSKDLVSVLNEKLQQMPHSVGKLLHENRITIRVATTMVDARPDLTNEEGRGYEGATYKSCPGMFTGNEIILAERTMNEGDESLRSSFSSDRVLHTFEHECGHAVDFCLGNVSESQEFKHFYLLDAAKLTRNSPDVANQLRYYMQKAEAGQEECCGELIGILLGKNDEKTDEMRSGFPLTLGFLKNKLHM